MTDAFVTMPCGCIRKAIHFGALEGLGALQKVSDEEGDWLGGVGIRLKA